MMRIPRLNTLFGSSDTGAGHNIIAPSSVAKAFYSRVPGALLDHKFGDGFSLW